MGMLASPARPAPVRETSRSTGDARRTSTVRCVGSNRFCPVQQENLPWSTPAGATGSGAISATTLPAPSPKRRGGAEGKNVVDLPLSLQGRGRGEGFL